MVYRKWPKEKVFFSDEMTFGLLLSSRMRQAFPGPCDHQALRQERLATIYCEGGSAGASPSRGSNCKKRAILVSN